MKSGAFRIGQKIIDLLDEAENADPYLGCLLLLTAVGIVTGRTKELALCCAQAMEFGSGSDPFEAGDDWIPPEEIDADLFR